MSAADRAGTFPRAGSNTGRPAAPAVLPDRPVPARSRRSIERAERVMFFNPPRRRARSAALTEADAEGGGGDASAAQLLQRLVGGDAGALDVLYRRESGRVYRYALAVCGNAAWAADATQEAFVALATRPQGFDPARGQIGAYLAGVARHALSARWRELRREVVDAAVVEEDAGALPAGDGAGHPHAAPGRDADAAASPEALLVQAQELQALWAALRALPVAFREAVVLVDLQERPYAEAAQIAGIELNTLRTRVHRARLRLAALLGAGAPAVPVRAEGARP